MDLILTVEDDLNINNLLKEALEKNGYQCVQAFSGTEALLALERQQFALVLLDLMLPGIPGDEVLRRIRETSQVPVIVLTARDALDTKVNLLLEGADDYITKPFEISEVLARVVAALRRGGQKTASEELIYGELRLERTAHKIFVGDHEVHLTRQEFRVLELLMRNPDRVFSKQEVYDYAWEESFIGEDKVINVHISNIRRKLKQFTDREYIETVWGIGFKLK